MNTSDRYNEEAFNNDDLFVVKEMVKSTRSNFIIISSVYFLMYLLSPFIPGRGSRPASPMIFQFSYFESLAWYFPLMALPILIYYFCIRNEFVDSKKGIKINMQTKVTKLKTLKSGIRIKVSNPDFKNQWIKINNGEHVADLKVNDPILINFLPKSKIALNCKKMTD